MNADGSDRKQISNTEKDIEGFKFAPDGSKVILLHSIEFNEIIKKNPDDLPKATGRRVTDLMYRHWDHYVESIQHPYVYDVTISNNQSSNWHGVLIRRASPTPVARRLVWHTLSPPILISIYII